jgi:molybdopterin-synthase adenylyltransferase
MDDAQLLRYSRHLLLPEIDVDGQQRLLDARVLLVGVGGLGSAAAIYLAASGVGHLVLADGDRVELSNLQRQIVHSTPRLGQAKTDSATVMLQQLNPDVHIATQARHLNAAELAELVRGVDLALDCSDNFATRYAINAACMRQRVPLVTAAALRWEGQIAVFDPQQADGPCYRCLYPDTAAVAETSCAANGIAAPVVGVMGVLQALQAIKLLVGAGDAMRGELMVFDALAFEFHRLRIRRREACPDCA